MRYINKQRHSKTCGPVALVNALRKLGLKIKYKSAIKMCGGDRVFTKGTSTNKLLKVFRGFGFDVVYSKCKISEARFFARQENFAVVACHYWETPERSKGHFTMIDDKGNFINNGSVKRYSRKRNKNTRKVWDHRWHYIIMERT